MKSLVELFKEVSNKASNTIYIGVDIHNTLIKKDSEMEFYPCAKMVLQHLSKSDNIVLIMMSGTWKPLREKYQREFSKIGIIFKYVNENPDLTSSRDPYVDYNSKVYINLGIDDKYGFEPEFDWLDLYFHLNLEGLGSNASMTHFQDLGGRLVSVYSFGKEAKLETESPKEISILKGENYEVSIRDDLSFPFSDLEDKKVYENGELSFKFQNKPYLIIK